MTLAQISLFQPSLVSLKEHDSHMCLCRQQRSHEAHSSEYLAYRIAERNLPMGPYQWPSVVVCTSYACAPPVSLEIWGLEIFCSGCLSLFFCMSFSCILQESFACLSHTCYKKINPTNPKKWPINFGRCDIFIPNYKKNILFSKGIITSWGITF